jgi:hypothetical protein
MKTEYVIIHKTKTRIYTSRYNIVGGKKYLMNWKARKHDNTR